jgi:hypothetical protein
MIKIGHEELKAYMLRFPIKSEEQMLAMINYFIREAINEYSTELGLATEDENE